jgi:hypothetical protein
MKTKSESGIAHVALLFLVMGVIAVIVVVGLRVIENQNAGESSSLPVASTGSSSAIKSQSDLNNTKDSLNKTDVDSDVNPNSLDSDINSVL